MTTRDKKLLHGIEISFGLNENHLIGNNNSIDALKRDFIPCILVLIGTIRWVAKVEH